MILYHRRELLFPGQTGGLVIFDDRPNYWDAWGKSYCCITFPQRLICVSFEDVEIHHLETRKDLTFSGMKIVASGPLRAAVEAEVKYGKSTIKVTVCGFMAWIFHFLFIMIGIYSDCP